MTTDISQLVGKVTSLVSFPDVALRVNQMLSDQTSTSEDIARVMASDPALTAALLKIANSALFSAGRPIDSVSKAITRLGATQIRQLTLGISAANSFKGVPNELVSVADFWNHSLYCAVISRIIASITRIAERDTAFTAGLLHDIGHLVIFSQLPSESRDFLALSLDESDGLVTYTAEQQVLGFDHTDVGAELARQWKLPDALRDAIFAHHQIDKLGAPSPLVMVVHIANSLAVLAELQSTNLADAPPIDPRAWASLRMDPSRVPEILPEARESVQELLAVFVR